MIATPCPKERRWLQMAKDSPEFWKTTDSFKADLPWQHGLSNNLNMET
tara:strand:+ start:287 stop:430 length:144 start_codon:yes stop_codon:yes gene_type:complete